MDRGREGLVEFGVFLEAMLSDVMDRAEIGSLDALHRTYNELIRRDPERLLVRRFAPEHVDEWRERFESLSLGYALGQGVEKAIREARDAGGEVVLNVEGEMRAVPASEVRLPGTARLGPTLRLLIELCHQVDSLLDAGELKRHPELLATLVEAEQYACDRTGYASFGDLVSEMPRDP